MDHAVDSYSMLYFGTQVFLKRMLCHITCFKVLTLLKGFFIFFFKNQSASAGL